MNNELNFPQNFEGLVLGCIDASKQASKVEQSLSKKKKREETQVSARNLSAPDLILPAHKRQYCKTNIEYRWFGIRH